MPYYRRNWGYRYWGRRYGVQRAQQQGTRRFSIAVPIEGAGSVSVAGGATNSTVFGFTPFFTTNRAEGTATRLNSFGSLIQNNLFITYTNLYDEVKLNSVYVELAISNTVGTSNAIKVVSAVDRHATLNDINQVANFGNLTGAAESDSKMFTSLNYAKVSRYFRARDRQESTIFVDSSIGNVQPEQTYTNAGLLEFLENGNLYGAFNPLVRFAFSVGAAPLAASTIGFQYRVIWNLTFRNPKYGANVGFQRGMNSVGMLMSDGVDREEAVDGTVEKKVKLVEPVKEESVAPVDDLEMGDESSQPQLTKEELLEMLKKYDEKKS